MNQTYQQLISDTLKWVKQLSEPFLSTPESYYFFSTQELSPSSHSCKPPATQPLDEIKQLLIKAAPNIKLKAKPSLIALVFFSQEEELFYQKLSIAIEQHLAPARSFDALHWEKEKEDFTIKWILSTQEVPGERQTPMIHLSSPPFYQNNLEAKKTLWKMLCQTLALPQSS